MEAATASSVDTEDAIAMLQKARGMLIEAMGDDDLPKTFVCPLSTCPLKALDGMKTNVHGWCDLRVHNWTKHMEVTGLW